MPIYSYECDSCHHHFDIFQHFTDDTLTICPNCKKKTLRKIYQPVGIVFKGSGFYATDHRSPSGQMPLASEKHDLDPENAAAPKKEDKPKKSETAKPAAKTESTASEEKSTGEKVH